MTELDAKIQILRESLAENNLSAIRLKGVDWFSWATGGGSNVVILTTETGIAEVFVTEQNAWILTDKIEAPRLEEEEVRPGSFNFQVFDWFDKRERERFIKDFTQKGKIASDRPTGDEVPLPEKVKKAKQRFLPEEIERYRDVGRLASEAMTEVLTNCHPDWTEHELTGHAARSLWQRGLHPTLILTAGEKRVARHRHPFPSHEKIGSYVMLVFCARKHGLYANFTRFLSFKKLSPVFRKRHEQVALVEAVALNESRPQKKLSEVYAAMCRQYRELDQDQAWLWHHQGGSTGYLSREVVATSESEERLEENCAIAWNPSLPGAKIEDTFLVAQNGVEALTLDGLWPTIEIQGRLRPVPWERG